MAMAIAHNLNAIGVQRTLNQSNASLSGSLEKLSTGYKINKGADDPSGLVISELLRSQTNGIARAIQNTQEANNVLGIAEGALNEMNNILTKMRQLAIHAANDGITSNEQIAADQAEIDSSIQTLDRIARTTTFSSENLLNGNKQINYDTSVLVKDSKDMPLIDKELTNVLQIFKRQDFQLNINFSGKNADGTDNGNAAKKAYFEITTQTPGAEATQVNDFSLGVDAYTLTHDQAFTLTGNGGSRYLTFAKGTHVGEMASIINSVKDSTGVRANLIFDSSVIATNVDLLAPPITSGDTDPSNGDFWAFVTSFGDTTHDSHREYMADDSHLEGAVLGENTDNSGKVYLKTTIDGTNSHIWIYKNSLMRDEDLVAESANFTAQNSGPFLVPVTAKNGSGLSGAIGFCFYGHPVPTITTTAPVSFSSPNPGGTVVSGNFSAPINNDNSDFVRAFNRDRDGKISTAGVTGIFADAACAENLAIGVNLDGDGRMYLKMITAEKYEIYKDAAMTMPIGYGNRGASSAVSAVNESGIAGMSLAFNGEYRDGATAVLQFNALAQDKNATDGCASNTDPVNLKGWADALGAVGGANVNNSYFSGVKLGYNTSDTGQLYLKADLQSSPDAPSQIWVYRDERMRDEDLVARSDKFYGTAAQSVSIFAELIGDTGYDTGLYGALNLGEISTTQKIESATVRFENLGVRISAENYGGDQFVKIAASQGAVWTRYDSDNQAHLLAANLSGAEWTNYGSNAILSLNGQRVELRGLAGTLANLDSTANIVFNQGSVGNTTIATVGYTDGSITTKAAVLGEVKNDDVNPLHSTTEIIGGFSGGMRLQLGEGAGDQNRTIYSIKDITAPFLGKMKFHDYFGNHFKSDRYLSIQDMMSGGPAALGVDSVKSMAIVTMAIKDVSEMRANIGAFQANMLETNANNLNVAFEQISKTESYIRDTDMATESTKFTKNQVMGQAGTSMLAQANQLPQSALSLIGG